MLKRPLRKSGEDHVWRDGEDAFEGPRSIGNCRSKRVTRCHGAPRARGLAMARTATGGVGAR